MANDPPNHSGTPDGDSYRDYLAQSWWPPPPAADAPAPPAAPPQPAPPPPPAGAQPVAAPAQQSAPGTPPNGWRSVGVAALGLLGGFLAAVVLQDIIGVALIRGADGTVPVGGALLIASLIPLLSAIGLAVALLIDRAARRRERARSAQR